MWQVSEQDLLDLAVGAAFLAPYIWTTGGVRGALLIASLIPLIQQPEGMVWFISHDDQTGGI